MLLQASRNGYFFVLDRTNGKSLLTKPFAAVNWSKGIDEQGRPIPDPAKEPSKDGVLIAPDEGGATNFWPPSFDPKTGLLIVNAKDGYGIYFYKPEHGAYGWAGADYGLAGKGFLRAIDYRTGKDRVGAPVSERQLFGGRAHHRDRPGNHRRRVRATCWPFEPATGRSLWHESIGRMGGAPVTYELDGKQYLLVSGGNTLYAYALP